MLYDPAETELAGAALIGRLSATTFGLFSCSARWIDERLALRRLLQAVADYARTRDATFLAVRTNANDVILREVLAELGYRAADRARGHRGASRQPSRVMVRTVPLTYRQGSP